MAYSSVAETAHRWNVSERTVRNYCASGRIPGAFLHGKTWNIPERAERPKRINQKKDVPEKLRDILRYEKENGVRGGIYHKVQVELTYNSNHMEGSRLTHEETRYIYETNTIGMDENHVINTDDIVETVNHFRCIDIIIERVNQPLSEALIKELHKTLKNGTSDSRKAWFALGEYKKLPNEVGGVETARPEEVAEKIKQLIKTYNNGKKKTLDDLLTFHYAFEIIHPFQDGNGRIGRLLLFKECLKNELVPFIIDEEHKLFYYRGLKEWKKERGYLRDTCLSAQDEFKRYLDYFRIPYSED